MLTCSRLAMVQLKLMLFSLIRNFDINVAPEQPQEEMEDLGAAVVCPRGERCLIRFTERVGSPERNGVRFDDEPMRVRVEGRTKTERGR